MTGIITSPKTKIYSKPSILSELVTVLGSGEEVAIQESESTSCFYKIEDSFGNVGFCMRPLMKKKGCTDEQQHPERR